MPPEVQTSDLIYFSRTWFVDLVGFHNTMADIFSDGDARQASSTSPSSRPRRRTDCLSLPFSTHPFYQLRRAIIIFAVIGVTLCSITPGYFSFCYPGPIGHSFMLLALCVFFCLLDLTCYATRKKDNPDEEPNRPTVRWAIVDLMLAILLQLSFWTSVSELDGYWMPQDVYLLAAYGSLAELICSVLHAVCFWKQLMAHKKQTWLLQMAPKPCERCGHVEDRSDGRASSPPTQVEPANVYPYSGPSAEFATPNVCTPDSRASAMEEGLLIGSEFGSDYGSIGREPVLEPPEAVLVSKGKKKAKSSGSQGPPSTASAPEGR